MLSLLVVGCASTQKMPKGLSLNHATIVAGDDESQVIIDGFPSKGTGAVVGGAVGGGVGLGVGILSHVFAIHKPPFHAVVSA